jgi:hypothetical protein
MPGDVQHATVRFYERRMTVHTKTVRQTLDVPKRGSCYIPEDKFPINTEADAQAGNL